MNDQIRRIRVFLLVGSRLLIARGLTNKEIASYLNLSEQTVKNHIHRMLRKVGANDRLEVLELTRVSDLLN